MFRRAKQLLPWLLAVCLVGYLLYTIPKEELWAALQRAHLVYLIAVVIYAILGSLVADSWATARVFSWFLTPVGFGELLPVRAATYLMAILNYHLGQAGLVYFVYRRSRERQVSLAAITGVILMILGTVLLLLTLFSVAGVVTTSDAQIRRYGWVPAAVGAGALVYFFVLTLKPRWLANRQLLAPLFAAGVLGHLKATLVRIPHVAVVVTGHLFAMRCFDVVVPLSIGLIYIPLLLLLASVPITPLGLGTMQLAAVHLFAGYAPGSEAARRASVLGYSLSLASLAMVTQATLGLFCLRRVINLIAVEEERPGEP
jgi:hypothetical protein